MWKSVMHDKSSKRIHYSFVTAIYLQNFKFGSRQLSRIKIHYLVTAIYLPDLGDGTFIETIQSLSLPQLSIFKIWVTQGNSPENKHHYPVTAIYLQDLKFV